MKERQLNMSNNTSKQAILDVIDLLVKQGKGCKTLYRAYDYAMAGKISSAREVLNYYWYLVEHINVCKKLYKD